MKTVVFRTIIRVLFREGESEKNMLFMNKALRTYKNIVDAAKIFKPYQAFWILNEAKNNTSLLDTDEINALIFRCLEDPMSSFRLLSKCSKMLSKDQKKLAIVTIQQDSYLTELLLKHQHCLTKQQKTKSKRIVKKWRKRNHDNLSVA